jgi:hypothetical protein
LLAEKAQDIVPDQCTARRPVRNLKIDDALPPSAEVSISNANIEEMIKVAAQPIG